MPNIERLKAVELAKLTKTRGAHHDGRGLYLLSNPPGAASWVFRYTLNGKARQMGFGSFPEVSLKRAREKALTAREQKAEGVDPIEARRADKVALAALKPKVTFETMAERFIRSKESGWRHRGKTSDQWRAAFRDWVYPLIGQSPVANIDGPAIMSVLSQDVAVGDLKVRFWEARSETASRCRARIENVLDFAKAHGEREGDNPADWAIVKFTLPKRSDVRPVEHHDAMPYPDVPGFIAKLQCETFPTARALEFTILTIARTTEVRAMTRAELGLSGKKIWTVPGSRMKGKKEHRVPLVDRAVELLGKTQGLEPGDYVFPGVKPGRPMSENTMLFFLQERRPNATVHGFRAAFSTWARDCTDFPREIAEACLAHTVGDAVERAYARTDFFDKRRKLLEAWAAFCAGG